MRLGDRAGARPPLLAPGRWIACVILCVALAGPLAAGASAAPAWLSPLDVSTPGADGREAQIAIDAAGDATAVWERFDGVQQTVQSASRPAGGPWQAPVTLSVDAPTEDSFLPQVAIDPAGDAMAVWAHFTSGHGEVVQAAARPAGGAWEAPLTISPEGNEVPHPEIALDARGDALAVWELHTAPANRIEASSRPAGGAWQAPVELSDPTHNATIGGIGVDPAGDAAVSFVQDTGSAEVIQVASRPAGGAWQKALEVSGGEAASPSVALDARGDARAIWTLKSGANWIVQSAYQPAGGAWQAPVELSPANSVRPLPRIAVDEAGDALADWLASDGKNALVQAALGAPDGSWQPAQRLSAPGRDAGEPRAAIDPRGNAFAAWERTNGVDELVEAATHPGGGTWQAPLPLSAEGGSASSPALAADAQGNAVAVWERSNGSNEIVQAAGYDGAPPVFGALQVPSSGYVGVPLAFSASPLDTWSGLASTDWSFGDGTSGTGTAVAHTYPAPGTYAVTVTSTDALGNATSASRTTTVVVRPPASAGAPTISALRQSHAVWRAGGKLASLARRAHGHRPPVGTTFSFALNEPARVSFAFSQTLGGRKVRGRCVAPSRHNRHRRACRRTLVRGTLSLAGHAGLDKLSFQGRISRSRKLGPGRYTLVLVATNPAGLRSRSARLSFKIVR